MLEGSVEIPRGSAVLLPECGDETTEADGNKTILCFCGGTTVRPCNPLARSELGSSFTSCAPHGLELATCSSFRERVCRFRKCENCTKPHTARPV